MKKLLFLFGILFVCGSLMAQNGKVHTVTVDTVKGDENVAFAWEVTKADVNVVFQALATNIGGTTNEKGYLEFSTDGTSWQRYANATTTDFVYLYASDTSKIANNGNEWTATTANSFGGVILKCPWRYIRVLMDGEANDTTQYTVKWAYK